MGVIVQFDWNQFILAFPQFETTLNPQQAALVVLPYAQQYCRNDGGGPVTDPGLQSALLNLMVAHVAQLLFGSSTQPVSPLVGRISSATEGSVSVDAEMPTTPQSAWYMQTVYGSMFYQLSLPFRTFRIIPHPWPQPQIGGYGGLYGGYGGPWGPIGGY